jgi:hypothetical protein
MLLLAPWASYDSFSPNHFRFFIARNYTLYLTNRNLCTVFQLVWNTNQMTPLHYHLHHFHFLRCCSSDTWRNSLIQFPSISHFYLNLHHWNKSISIQQKIIVLNKNLICTFHLFILFHLLSYTYKFIYYFLFEN